MIPFYFSILALWAVFLIALAVTAGKVQPEAAIPHDEGSYVGVYITAVLAFLIFFRGHIFGSSSHYYAFTSSHHIVGVIGTLLCLLGVGLALFVRVQSTRTEDNKLPFNADAYLRYPMFVGVLVAMVGSALVGGIPWALIAVASAIYMGYRIAYAEDLIPEAPFAALGTFKQFKHRARNFAQAIF